MSDQLERLTAALADRYAIERELGAGGMAIVYLAEDLKHGRKVAVKVLRPEFASAMGSDRFLREIAITAQLSHPHILPLLDSGHADGFLFYVMPYVDGESLRDLLNRKKQLPVDETLRLTTEIADALGSAHRRGVIHRDVKPENILLEEGHAVVADFGIARAMSAAGGDRLTVTGLAVGTPAYMSPEQMSGESHVDERSDIYGLGCVVYEMLAGEHPFTGATMQAVLARKATGEVPKLRTVRSGVPASVENAIMKSLASVPSERFASAPEFAAALATKHPSTASRNRKFTVLVIAGVLAIVILGFFGVLPGTIRPAAAAFFAESDRVVVAEFENDTDQPALGLAIREAVTTDLEQSEYVNVVERPEINDVLQRMRLPDTTRFDLEVAREVARRQGYPAVVVGGISPVGAGYQLSVQIVEVSTGEVAVRIRETAANDTEVLKAVERLTHLTRRHLGESLASVRRSQPLPTVTTSSLEALQSFARGADYAARGNFGAAIPHGVQAVQEDTAFAAAHRALSIWYQNFGDPVSAQAHINLAHRFDDRLHPRERYLVGATYNSFRGQLDSTEYYYRLTLDRYLNDVTALNNLGDLRERMGR
ncbi:MAG: protein kinase, partial [Phycisphaerae bacterium]